MVPIMTERDFKAFFDLYKQRLDFLRDEVIRITDEAKSGERGQCEAWEQLEEIDREVIEIVHCGRVLRQIRQKGE